MTIQKPDMNSDAGTHGHREQRRVGLIYDDRMRKHFSRDKDYHPENPNRILAIWNKLQSAGIPQRCVVFSAKDVEDKYLEAVHTTSHVDLVKNISSKNFDSRRNTAEKFNSIYFNEGSSEAACLSAGSVVEVAEKVAKGELNSAFAIVRPPGHHAEENEPMGFCLYNNVAVATSFLLNKKELGINKILIVDWDVHHGNGTQKMFWKDPRVLFFSVHRHEFGSFYPCGDDGSHVMIGEGPGAGYNVNVPWENCQCGDADYLAVWDHVLMPIAKEFSPDIIIISAGFDAVPHQNFHHCITPRVVERTPKDSSDVIVTVSIGVCTSSTIGCNAFNQLMEFAQGKIIMVLEGGYHLGSLAKSVLACVEVLLEDKPITGSSEGYPFESTWRVIQAVRQELSAFWPVLKDDLPQKLPSRKFPPVEIPSFDSDVEDDDSVNVPSQDLEDAVEAVLQPFSELTVEGSNDDSNTDPASWRSKLSKVDIWYACYGSNMYKSRFLCYIEGGQVEGMKKPCTGSMDKSPSKETIWKVVPHRLFFGYEGTKTWGPGGVAFLHPESSSQDKAYICLYRITLEQFNDVLVQENVSSYDMNPAFDLTDLDSVRNKLIISPDILKGGWYHDVLFMGDENSIPILTFTCSNSDVKDFKSGKIPLRPPAKEYAYTLIRGLVEGNQLSQEEAEAYIQEASSKPL